MSELRLSYRQWSEAVARGLEIAPARDWLAIVSGRVCQLPGPDRGLKRAEWRKLDSDRRRLTDRFLCGFISGRELLFFPTVEAEIQQAWRLAKAYADREATR